MPNVPQFYWAANKWKERLEKWESTEAPESLRRRNNESCKEELPWSALLHPGPCSFIGHDISENVRIREDDDKKLRTGVRDLAESNNDGAGNLIVFPQTFQTPLRYGKTIFLRSSPLAFPNYDDAIIILLHRLRSSFEQYIDSHIHTSSIRVCYWLNFCFSFWLYQ